MLTEETAEFSPDQAKVIKRVNKYLSSSKTRAKGLSLILKHLHQCSDSAATENCVIWMQQCCKNDYDNLKVTSTSFEALKQLLQLSSSFPELNKSVSSFVNTRFFDQFFKYLSDSEVGWLCAETCFSLYSGPCGPHSEKIESCLTSHMKRNAKISPTLTRCYALLPGLGGGGVGGVNHKTNWKNQFSKLIKKCHGILNILFADVLDLQTPEIAKEYYCNPEDATPEHLTIQLYNYCSALQSMLLNKFPVAKSISPDLILSLICRGLAVTPKTLGNKETSNVIRLRKILPEICVVLHETLNALITACTTHLLPYSHLICKLIKQTLEWTSGDRSYGSESPFATPRVSAYATLCNWLIATKSGGCTETISQPVIFAIMEDMKSQRPTVLLQNTKDSKGSKANEKRQIRRVTADANGRLCYSALKALQLFLKSVGHLLKPQEQENLQIKAIALLLEVQSCISAEEILIPYSVAKCRRELYSTLLSLTQNPCPKRAPPTQFAVRIFGQGQNDPNLQISQTCSTALSMVMHILHPEFSVATFPRNVPYNEDGNEGTQRAVTLIWKETQEPKVNGGPSPTRQKMQDKKIQTVETGNVNGTPNVDVEMADESEQGKKENREEPVDEVSDSSGIHEIFDIVDIAEHDDDEPSGGESEIVEVDITDEKKKRKRKNSEEEAPPSDPNMEKSVEIAIRRTCHVEIEPINKKLRTRSSDSENSIETVEFESEGNAEEESTKASEKNKTPESSKMQSPEEKNASGKKCASPVRSSPRIRNNDSVSSETKKTPPSPKKQTPEADKTTPKSTASNSSSKSSRNEVESPKPSKKKTIEGESESEATESQQSATETAEAKKSQVARSEITLRSAKNRTDSECSTPEPGGKKTSGKTNSEESSRKESPTQESDTFSEDEKNSDVGKTTAVLLPKLVDTSVASPSRRYNLRKKGREGSVEPDEIIRLRSGPKLRHSVQPEKASSVSSDSGSVRSNKHNEEDDILKSFDESLNN